MEPRHVRRAKPSAMTRMARGVSFACALGFALVAADGFAGEPESDPAGLAGFEALIAAHGQQGELETRRPKRALGYSPVTYGAMTAARADAAAQTDEIPEADPDWPEPRQDSINIRLLRNFRIIDDSHAIFIANARRPFLVTFAGFCPELRFALRILTASRTDRLCGGAGERIIVRGRRCFVRTIERVASDEQARYLVAVRTAQPADDDQAEPMGSAETDL